MIKVVLLVAALLAVYFLFVYDELPSKLVFQGQTFDKEDKEVFERANGKFAIYKYHNKLSNNFLVFVVSENKAVVPVDDINQYYIKRIEEQGFKLALNEQGRYLGYRHDAEGDMGQVYMTYATTLDGIIVYIRNTEQNVAKKRDVERLFVELESFTF